MAMSEAFRESTTLKLVIPAWLLIMGKYAISDLMIFGSQTTYIDPAMFGGAIALVLAPWLHREWRKDRYPNGRSK